MEKNILKLESFISSDPINRFRTIIKTQHGRVMYLSIEINNNHCIITDCFYTDRNQGRTGVERYSSKPLKLKTFKFPIDKLLSVIYTELDKKFYGIEFITTENVKLSLDEYIHLKTCKVNSRYQFLIMIGDGEVYNKLPAILHTRIKNSLHRAIYVELAYYKEGKGVIKQCYYYDRQYKRLDVKVAPPQLVSCFFPYTNEGILNLFNHELCCDFTHIIVTEGIDIITNFMPLCGAI